MANAFESRLWVDIATTTNPRTPDTTVSDRYRRRIWWTRFFRFAVGPAVGALDHSGSQIGQTDNQPSCSGTGVAPPRRMDHHGTILSVRYSTELQQNPNLLSLAAMATEVIQGEIGPYAGPTTIE